MPQKIYRKDSRLLDNSERRCSDAKKSNQDNGRLLHTIYEGSRERGMDAVVKAYLEEKSTNGPFTLDASPSKTFRGLFVRFNTPIPLSAAVEKMIILRKKVLKPKRSRMTDEHFEMLVFLRGNFK